MSDQNKKMVRQAFEQIWNYGNLAVIDERFASDYVEHSASAIQGPEEGKRLAVAMRTAFPDFHYAVKDEIAQGDRVVHRWIARGTHAGEYRDIPPTGKQVTIQGISIYRVAGAKMVEGWTNADMLGLLQQLGTVPGT
jgi:predicted ester cyclase